MAKIPYKIYLEEEEMPKQWHNVRAYMKEKPEPFINPASPALRTICAPCSVTS